MSDDETDFSHRMVLQSTFKDQRFRDTIFPSEFLSQREGAVGPLFRFQFESAHPKQNLFALFSHPLVFNFPGQTCGLARLHGPSENSLSDCRASLNLQSISGQLATSDKSLETMDKSMNIREKSMKTMGKSINKRKRKIH